MMVRKGQQCPAQSPYPRSIMPRFIAAAAIAAGSALFALGAFNYGRAIIAAPSAAAAASLAAPFVLMATGAGGSVALAAAAAADAAAARRRRF